MLHWLTASAGGNENPLYENVLEGARTFAASYWWVFLVVILLRTATRLLQARRLAKASRKLHDAGSVNINTLAPQPAFDAEKPED